MNDSIGDKVYKGLRNSIITLKMKPGEEIRINLIAETLGVSRSPVRDALLELEKEGLVTILPQIGTRVSKIDMERMHEERFLRECLEEKTLEIFMDCHVGSDLRRLSAVLAEQRESLERGDLAGFLDLDDDFHFVFFESAGKKMCWETIRNMSGHYRRVRLLNLREAEAAESVLAQHRELYALIAARDAPGALRLMKEHLTKIIVEEKDLLREFPEYFKADAAGDFFAAI
jgi:DNA-binding GntR family transcriptional regulator